MNKRARDEEAKKARRQAILDAAERLLEERDVSMISVSQVAKACGLAKGTLYLYFKTKEEIFVALLKTQFGLWLKHIREVAVLPGMDLPQLMNRIVGFVAQRPRFLALASVSSSILEQNLTYEVTASYKTDLIAQLQETGLLLEQVFKSLPTGEGVRMLMFSYAAILGMWQLAEPPQIVREVIEGEKLAALEIDFEQQTVEALSRMWMGLIAGASLSGRS